MFKKGRRLAATGLLLVVAGLLWAQGLLLQSPQAVISWSTASEVDTAGFHVYRATQPEGPFQRVTEALIPSSGDPFSGATYEFRDAAVEPSVPYFYQIEELETSGTFNRLPDTERFQSGPVPNWIVLSGLLAALCLVWLLPAPPIVFGRPRDGG